MAWGGPVKTECLVFVLSRKTSGGRRETYGSAHSISSSEKMRSLRE